MALNRKWFDNNGRIIESKVQSYAANGCHHLRDKKERFKFEELARVVLNEFPAMRTEFEIVANLDLLPVEELIDDIKSMVGVPERAQMTSRRGVQVMRLLHEGQARVRRCLEDKI